jgi:hypothetical protein
MVKWPQEEAETYKREELTYFVTARSPKEAIKAVANKMLPYVVYSTELKVTLLRSGKDPDDNYGVRTKSFYVSFDRKVGKVMPA